MAVREIASPISSAIEITRMLGAASTAEVGWMESVMTSSCSLEAAMRADALSTFLWLAIALVVDGDIYTHGVNVEFFGRTYHFPAGPGVLAQRTGALIVCGYCERVSPGKFRMVMEKPLDPADFATVADVNQAVASRVEEHIRGHLDQWCIFRPMWEPPAQPAEAPSGDARSAEA